MAISPRIIRSLNRRHKFHAVRTEVDGHSFPSKKEARRYGELKLLERAGKISHLELQPVYPLKINGVDLGKYIGDFKYWDVEKKCGIVEDVKGVKTPIYKLKAKLVKALYGIEVLVT